MGTRLLAGFNSMCALSPTLSRDNITSVISICSLTAYTTSVLHPRIYPSCLGLGLPTELVPAVSKSLYLLGYCTAPWHCSKPASLHKQLVQHSLQAELLAHGWDVQSLIALVASKQLSPWQPMRDRKSLAGSVSLAQSEQIGRKPYTVTACFCIAALVPAS